MAKKVKEASIEALYEASKDMFPKATEVEWNGIKLNIKYSLDLTDTMVFVHEVVDNCISKEEQPMVEMRDFFIKVNMLTRYAGLAMIDDPEKTYDLLYNTDIIDVISDHINNEQLTEILDAIDLRIKMLCDSNAVELEKRVEALVVKFEEIGESMGTLFSNITEGDVTSMMGALKGGNIDEGAIVKAYLEQSKGKKKRKA